MAGRGRVSNGLNFDREDFPAEIDSHINASHFKHNQKRETGLPTLHVANIPVGLDEKGLSNIFAAESSVPERVYISKNKKNQQANTHWGFVEFKTVAEAQSAISAVHRKPPYELFVQFSKAYQDNSKEKTSDKSMGNMGPNRGQEQFSSVKERNSFRTSRSNDETHSEDFGEDLSSLQFSSPAAKNTNSPAEKLSGLPIEKYTHVEITDEMDLHVAAYMSNRAKDLTLNDLSDLCSEIKLALPFKPGQCSYCLRTAIYMCSRCKTWYCSDFCRTIHWPQHKDKCSPRSVIFEKDGTLTYKDVPDAFCTEQNVIQKNVGVKSPRGFQGKNVGHQDYQNDGFHNNHAYDNGFERNNTKFNDKFRDNVENRNRSPDDRYGRENHTASEQGNRSFQRNNRRTGDRRGGGRQQGGGRPDRNSGNRRSKTNESDCYNIEESFNGPDLDKPQSQSQKSSNLNKAPIPPATFTKVTVGALGRDNEFWAFKLDDYTKQGSMMSELKKCVLQGDLPDLRIEIGSKCIAPYEGDWYRAEIMQIFKENVKVVFIDFGNESDVKKCDLKSLPEYIASEPPMAHRFVLANSPDNPKIHEELTFSIKPVTQNKSGVWVVHADGVCYSAPNGFEDS